MKKRLVVFILGICFLSGCSKADEIQSNTAEPDKGCFFPQDITSCTYDGIVFWEQSAQPEEIVLSITKVQSMEAGDLYELKIDCSGNAEDRFGVDRSSLGLFFIQEDSIYLIDNEAVKGQSLTAEEMINTGRLVCNEAGMDDILQENERGWHEYILIDGNKREYHSYNNMTETGYYECFTWEPGKGLVGYRSGYGAEADAIDIFYSE